MNEPFSNPSALIYRLHELVSDHPDFEVLRPSSLDGYCFRYIPNELADRRDEPDVQRLLDDLNQQIVGVVQCHGHACRRQPASIDRRFRKGSMNNISYRRRTNHFAL